MTDSSVPPVYSISSLDTTVPVSTMDTITITSFDPATAGLTTYGSAISGYSGSPISISGSNNYPTITGLTSAQLNTISGFNGTDYSTFTFNTPEDWVNQFPDWSRVQRMCEEYPGLKIVFEKFKTTYKLVKDHYDTPADQRPLP
jgi:hypothetical protein